MDEPHSNDLWTLHRAIYSQLKLATEREGVPHAIEANAASSSQTLARCVDASKGNYTAEEKGLAREALQAWQAFQSKVFEVDENELARAVTTLSGEKERLRPLVSRMMTSGDDADQAHERYESESQVMLESSHGKLADLAYSTFQGWDTTMWLLNFYCPIADLEWAERYYESASYATKVFQLDRLRACIKSANFDKGRSVEADIKLHAELKKLLLANVPSPKSEKPDAEIVALTDEYDFEEDEDDSLAYTKIGKRLSEEEKQRSRFTTYTGEVLTRKGLKGLSKMLDDEWKCESKIPHGLRLYGNASDSTEQAVKAWACKKAEQLQTTFISYESLAANAELLQAYRKDSKVRKQYFVLVEANLRTVEKLPWLYDVDRSGATGMLLLTEFTRGKPMALNNIQSIIEDRSPSILVIITGHMPALDEDAIGLTDPKQPGHYATRSWTSVAYFDETLP